MRIIYPFLIIFSLFFTACKNETPQQAATAMPFQVVQVPTKTVTAYDTYPATIEGTNNSAIRAKMSGYITKVLVDEGQKVRKGQTLFTLETQSLSQDAGAAKANVNAAQVEVDKLIPLVEKNIISNVQLETAKARLAQAESAYNSILANIGYANISSPIDGYVGSIPYREGALVTPSDPSPLTTVSTTEEVFVFFALNEKQYFNFLNKAEGKTREEKVNNFAEVELELIDGTIYAEKGKIETVSGQINPNTGTVSFRAKFKNPTGILANGNSGRIRIPILYEDVLVVPETATFERQGKVYVYQVVGDTLAVNIPINVVARVNPYVVIDSGLKEGDVIIFRGIDKLRGETPVVPQLQEFDSVVKPLTPVFK